MDAFANAIGKVVIKNSPGYVSNLLKIEDSQADNIL
jgi:hypothetical protein